MGATAGVCFDFVGKQVWDSSYGSEEGKRLYGGVVQVEGCHVCPMQLRHVVSRQLMHYAKVLEAKQFQQQARAAEQLLVEASETWANKRKTMRASPYGVMA